MGLIAHEDWFQKTSEVSPVRVQTDYGFAHGKDFQFPDDRDPFFFEINRVLEWNAVGRLIEHLQKAGHEVVGYMEFLIVYPSKRGEGKGTELLKRYLKQSQATAVLIYAQPAGNLGAKDLRWLVQWYVGQGFRTIRKMSEGAVMLLEKS